MGFRAEYANAYTLFGSRLLIISAHAVLNLMGPVDMGTQLILFQMPSYHLLGVLWDTAWCMLTHKCGKIGVVSMQRCDHVLGQVCTHAPSIQVACMAFGSLAHCVCILPVFLESCQPPTKKRTCTALPEHVAVLVCWVTLLVGRGTVAATLDCALC